MSAYSDIFKKQVESRKNHILATKDFLGKESSKIDSISDKDWITKNFLVSEYGGTTPVSSKVKIRNRFHTSAVFKAFDSSPGGNYEMNPEAQFTPYADIRIKGKVAIRKDVRITETSSNLGMGHYYSEAIDDSKQLIHIRAGVPEFNTWTAFFTHYYNADLGALARTGRDGSVMEKIGYAAGIVVSAFSFPLAMFSLVMGATSVMLQMTESKFYKLKGTPHLYWGIVNSLVNEFAIYSGLYPAAAKGGGGAQNYYKMDTAAMQNFHNLMPEVFSSSGAIDVYSISNRATRKRNELDRALVKAFESGSTMNDVMGNYERTAKNIKDNYGPFNTFMKALFGQTPFQKKPKEGTPEFEKMLALEEPPPTGFLKYLEANLDDGAKFVTFRVQHTGTVSESFTNSTAKNDVQVKHNSISAQMKALNYTFAGGNVGGVIGAALDGVKALVQGFASSFNLENLLSMAGQAFIDIPRHWEDSQAKFNTSSYKMVLTSHSGDPISQIINMWLPFFCIFALAVPRAVGKQSYTAPFLVEFYDKGRGQSRLGIIDSLSVERGSPTNLGFDSRGKAMSLTVSFSISDLTDIIAVPLNTPIGFADLTSLKQAFYDNESAFTDYMYSLAGASLAQQTYWFNKFRVNLAKASRNIEFANTSAKIASIFGHSVPIIRDLDILFKGQTR